ncbi:hypothetical protein H6P81_021727 [Aristolochia fimbriata]|uniref:Uncharacterized protein n=1 Tax=Aristolochia fimbriata TaxID=158543 RepID=A0AAV7DP46_ARIFI|nr:hypothetical protein H6P81_021727 [Aristolochia fimbriata]
MAHTEVSSPRASSPLGDPANQPPCALRFIATRDTCRTPGPVVSRRVEWGARWATPRARGCHYEGIARGGQVPSWPDDVIAGRSSAWPRDSRRVGRSPPSQRADCFGQFQIRPRAQDATVFPPDLGRTGKALPTEATAAGVLQSWALTGHSLEATQARGRSHHCRVAEAPLKQSSQPTPAGARDHHLYDDYTDASLWGSRGRVVGRTRRRIPGRCILDPVACNYAQRLRWFAGSRIHNCIAFRHALHRCES